MLAHFMVRLYIAVVCSYGEALADRIISYRDILSDIVSYLSFSLMAVSCHHYFPSFSAPRNLHFTFTFHVPHCCSLPSAEEVSSLVLKCPPMTLLSICQRSSAIMLKCFMDISALVQQCLGSELSWV